MAKLPFPSAGGNPVAQNPMDVWTPTTDAESMTDGAPGGLVPKVPETPMATAASGSAIGGSFAPSSDNGELPADGGFLPKPHPEADGD